MVKSIPKSLYDLNEGVNKIQNKICYPADVKKYMLDAFKEIKKNSGVFKRAERKIGKTLKKILPGTNPEKGSLTKKNKKLLDSFNYLYGFFSYCTDPEIIKAKIELSEATKLNLRSSEATKISKSANGFIDKITKDITSLGIEEKSYETIIKTFGEKIGGIFGAVKVAKGSNLNLAKNFEEVCKNIITSKNGNEYKSSSVNYSTTDRKLKQIEEYHMECTKQINLIMTFLESKILKKANPADLQKIKKDASNIQSYFKNLKHKLENYRGIINYGETFYKGKNQVNRFISPLIKNANNYNKQCQLFITILQSPKCTSENLGNCLSKISERAKAISDTFNIIANTSNNTKKFNPETYNKSVEKIYEELSKIKADKFKEAANMDGEISSIYALISETKYNNSIKCKALKILEVTLRVLDALATIMTLIPV